MYWVKKNVKFSYLAMMVLTVAILSGCTYNDAIKDLRSQKEEVEYPIAFTNGVIDNPVRTRAVSLLSDHMNTMGVWGWQNTPESVVERIFLNQEVTFNNQLGKWFYSPVKYWDLNSNYRFYAYAPHTNSVPGVTASIDESTKAISIKGVTLKGCNTITTGSTQLPANFNGVDDVDWMIDRTGQSMDGKIRAEVAFNMKHILSKLCVRVISSSKFSSNTATEMTLDSIKIGDFVSQGNFTQSMTDDPNLQASEWTPIDTQPRYQINSAHNVSVTGSGAYVLESLIIPQQISNQKIQVWYTIGRKDAYQNHMYDILDLSNLFTGFESDKNYIINIIIGPDPIVFSSDVQNWSNNQIIHHFNY